MSYDMKHLFVCLFAVSSSSLRCLCKSLAYFFKIISLIFSLLSLCSLYILDNSLLSDMPLQIFSPRVNLSSNSQHCLSQSRAFNFSEIYPVSYLFNNYGFGVLSKKSSPNPRSSLLSLMLPYRSFILLHFTFLAYDLKFL